MPSIVLKSIVDDMSEDNSMVPMVSAALLVNVTLIVIAVLLWLYARYTKYKTQLV
jgi:cbb3-type cytochrome oxidase subunit 3